MSKSNFTCIEDVGSSRWTRRPLNMASKCNLYKSWSYFEGNALAGNEIHSNHKTSCITMNHTFKCMSSTSAERSLGHFRTQMAYKVKSSQKWSEDLTQAQDMIVHIENGGFNYLALETRVSMAKTLRGRSPNCAWCTIPIRGQNLSKGEEQRPRISL